MNEHHEAAGDIEAGQEWRVSRFIPEDAPGVVNLFRSVYGDGYPVRTYIDPKLLIEENDANRTVSVVAKTVSGAIVGHNALFNSAPFSGTFEAGAGVVHSSYRGGKGIFTQLVMHCIEIAREIPDVHAVFGEPVCNHPFSQKLGVKMGWIARALEVDLMPAEAYEKEVSAAGRVAAFLDFGTIRSKPQSLYLPALYEEDCRFFYEDFDDERQFCIAEDSIPAGTLTDMRPQIFGFAAVARVAFHAIGADFSTCLDTLEKNLQQEGILVTQLWLRLDCPWVGAATEILRDRGYFIGGVLPRWFDADGLLMQKMKNRPDWEGIVTCTERGAEILKRVRADWQRTQS